MSLLIKDVLPELGFTPIGVPGYEADDIIATISRGSEAYEQVYIMSCDRDLCQLSNPRVKVILFNSAKKIELIDEAGVEAYFGVPPSEVNLVKALSGDSSDNVRGIKGVGPKTAVKIIQDSRLTGANPEFSTADRIAFHPKVVNNVSTFLENLRLVSLDNDVPNLRWYASTPPSRETVVSIFEQLEFKSFLKESRLKKILKALNVESIPSL